MESLSRILCNSHLIGLCFLFNFSIILTFLSLDKVPNDMHIFFRPLPQSFIPLDFHGIFLSFIRQNRLNLNKRGSTWLLLFWYSCLMWWILLTWVLTTLAFFLFIEHFCFKMCNFFSRVNLSYCFCLNSWMACCSLKVGWSWYCDSNIGRIDIIVDENRRRI